MQLTKWTPWAGKARTLDNPHAVRISATILLASSAGGTLEWKGILFAVIAFVVALVMVAFMAAEFIDKYLGNTGRMILTRLLGVLLAALSVQFVVDGMKALLA